MRDAARRTHDPVVELRIATGLVDFSDDVLGDLVESPSLDSIVESRDQRPSYDEKDDCLVLERMARFAEWPVRGLFATKMLYGKLQRFFSAYACYH